MTDRKAIEVAKEIYGTDDSFTTNKEREAWIEAVKDDGIPLTEGSYYYPLWKFFNDEHNLVLLDADIQEILHQVEKFKQGK